MTEVQMELPFPDLRKFDPKEYLTYLEDLPLLSIGSIRKRLSALAKRPGMEAVEVVVPILSGAMVFSSDLMVKLEQPLMVEPVFCDSYYGESTRKVENPTIELQWKKGMHNGKFKDKKVLILDTVHDTGRTAQAVSSAILNCRPESIIYCCLLKKENAHNPKGAHTEVGFQIKDDAFVVGYGMDYRGYYRNLPYVGELKKEALKYE